MSFSSKVDVLELLTTVLKEQVEKLEEMVDQIEKDMDEQRYINRCIKYAMLQQEPYNVEIAFTKIPDVECDGCLYYNDCPYNHIPQSHCEGLLK